MCLRNLRENWVKIVGVETEKVCRLLFPDVWALSEMKWFGEEVFLLIFDSCVDKLETE